MKNKELEKAKQAKTKQIILTPFKIFFPIQNENVQTEWKLAKGDKVRVVLRPNSSYLSLKKFSTSISFPKNLDTRRIEVYKNAIQKELDKMATRIKAICDKDGYPIGAKGIGFSDPKTDYPFTCWELIGQNSTGLLKWVRIS